jgi:hypothetical protein
LLRTAGHIERRYKQMCEANYPERVHTEHAVLDIGSGVGALIIYTPETWRGKEIEVSPQGHGERKIHTQVLERMFGGKRMCAALYLELSEAKYDIWGDDLKPVDQVTILGGQVAELDWR